MGGVPGCNWDPASDEIHYCIWPQDIDTASFRLIHTVNGRNADHALSMSDDGNVVQAVDNFGVSHVFVNVFKHVQKIVSPSYELVNDAGYGYLWTSAVSGDGSTLALGNWRYEIVQIFRFNGTDWDRLGKNLTGAHNFGTSMGFSFNGDVMVIGADECCEKGPNLGQLQRYKLKNETWVKVGNPIVGENMGDEIGRLPLKVSDDGNNILVGGGTNGFVSAYDWDDRNGWKKIKRFTHDREYSVDAIFLSKDGKIVAIGEEDYGEYYSGAIYFFERNGQEFVEYMDPLVGLDYSYLGYNFDMSDNGDILVSANYRTKENKCKVEIMKKVISSEEKFEWQLEQSIKRCGQVRLSQDGRRLVIGGNSDSDTASIYFYEFYDPSN